MHAHAFKGFLKDEYVQLAFADFDQHVVHVGLHVFPPEVHTHSPPPIDFLH